MKKNLSIIFISFLMIIAISHIFIQDQVISFAERRLLKEFPVTSFEDIWSANYLNELEKYLLDQMPFRDHFRQMKSWVELNIFHKKDVNDLFIESDHIFKLEYPYDQASVDRFIDYVKKIENKYDLNNIHLAIIPDKNYFLEDDYLKLNYSEIREKMAENFQGYIDLFDVLSLDDYYQTDPHWRQDQLGNVLNLLADSLKVNFTSLSEYKKNVFSNFLGAYAAQSAFNVEEELLKYLSLHNFEELQIHDYEDESVTTVYNPELLEGLDPYDVYLSGASPLISIENKNAKTSKELIIFRDSFASSIAPLMFDTYQKITLVDTRYVSYEYLGEWIDFDGQDVLFLYSTLVVNNSNMLK